jgi:pyruvate/2-oxoglutarate dehydrogenase complex dihydrolipoamide acyltransferase (E2) component
VNDSTPCPDSDTSTPDVLISDAVQKYADEHDIDVSLIEGSGKQGRVIKSDVAKAIQDKVDAEEDAVDDDDDLDDLFGDDDVEYYIEEVEAAPVTIDDVREAMKAFQIAAKNKLIAKKKKEADAKAGAIKVARKLLKEVAGTEKMGAVTPDQYADIIEAAGKATAKLS